MAVHIFHNNINKDSLFNVMAGTKDSNFITRSWKEQDKATRTFYYTFSTRLSQWSVSNDHNNTAEDNVSKYSIERNARSELQVVNEQGVKQKINEQRTKNENAGRVWT